MVTITAPAAPFTRVTSNTLTIAGTAASAVGVDEVFVRVGAEVVTIQAISNSLKWVAHVELAPGTNVITATVTDLLGRSATNTRVVYRVALEAITLNINPSGAGTVKGVANQQLQELGRGYTITAVPGAGFAFSNWSGALSSASATLNYVMQSNLMLTANFIPNPFAAWAGNYNGLYLGQDDARHEHRGFLSALVRSDGGYSGKLQNGLRSSAFTGRFDVNGYSTNAVAGAATNKVTLELALDLHGGNAIAGRVVASDWNASVAADRAVFNRTNPAPFVNVYTLLIPGGTDDEERPGGYGFGSASINALGNLKFSGVLADGTPVTQAVPVSSRGDWPLYLPLNGGKGSAIGWVAFTNSPRPDLGGAVNWFRPALASGTFYTNGFSLDSPLVGSAYAPPGTNRLVNLDSAFVTFTDDDLHGLPTNTVSFGPSGRITNTGPNKLVLTATPATGWLKGTFTIPGSNSVINFKGVILQKQGYGGGFHLGPNEPGGVYIGP